MRNHSLILLILFGLLVAACTTQYPNSIRPTVYSTKTGLNQGWPYFEAPFYNYKGFPEQKLIKRRSVKWESSRHLSKEEKEAESKEQGATMSKVIVEPLQEDMPLNYAPGGIFITPLQLFFDETEVANIHWQEFLHYIKRDSTEAFYQSMIPDTTVIVLNERDYYRFGSLGVMIIGTDTIDQIIEPITSYLYHPQYLYYPVVGVNYEQAVAYCQWRSKVVTEQYNIDPKNEQKLKITYRLPTEQEWEVIASTGLDKIELPHSSYTKGTVKYKVNPKAAEFIARKIISPKPVAQIEQDLKQTEVHDLPINVKRTLPYILQFRTPAYVYGGWPNDYGAYHVLGNVAEMVAEKGIAKGGSWKDELSDSEITDRQLYTSPSDKVGFRCVCEAELLK